MHKTLVSAETLREYLDDPRWIVFDCRSALEDPEWGPGEYRDLHIPGARYAHLDRDLSGPRGPDTGRHPLPDADAFARWLGANGVDHCSQVVAYDQGGGPFAPRLWWMLRWVGHEAVAVLDGGWTAWMAAGLPVSEEIPEPKAVAFEPRHDDESWLTSEALVAALPEQSVQLIDARGAERFRGENEPIDLKPGHVPGALNLPFQGNLDGRGRFKDPEALKARFDPVLEQAGDREIVHMCGSGVTACHNLLAMEVAGLGETRLYAGSWSEWITDPERPIETGD